MAVRDVVQAAAGALGGDKLYVEDVFSTYLYTGNGSTQTITNGIDLDGEGGLVWIKSRSAVYNHNLYDTARGATKLLETNTIDAESTVSNGVTAFTSNGFSLGSATNVNTLNQTFAAWAFRKAEKFFTVVTYTGNGVSGRQIAHDLGSAPGCMIIRRRDPYPSYGPVYHRSRGYTEGGLLGSTTGFSASYAHWGGADPTSTYFTVNDSIMVNASGSTYVAYLFAHDAGGFGDDGEQNVISCGSYLGDGISATVSLGWEPQWILIKKSTTSAAVPDWHIYDSMRGIPNGSNDNYLRANLADVEVTAVNNVELTSTGFIANANIAISGETYIYIAIRRGPMKTPESGTEVFAPVTYTGTNVDNRLVDTGLLTDMTMARIRTVLSTGSFYVADRLRGNASLGTKLTDAENTDADSFMTPTSGYGNAFSAMNGFGVGNDVTRQLNGSSTSQLAYAFRRAPGFFDEVCYTGTGSATTINHNLGVIPELILVKGRSATIGWLVYSSALGNTGGLRMDTNVANIGPVTWWNNTTPTNSVFSLGSSTGNNSGVTFVAYLFATLAGVSKVGSYTGTGTTQQINCGFTSGARFVLIKRTNTTGDWWVFDTARGIVAGNDPYLRLNATDEEYSSDYIDTYSAGFELSSTAPAELNGSGDSFIFLAIA